MKTTTVARGFIGAVASLLGVVAVGCSAGGADEASAGNGEIGSVEQAVVIAEVSSAGPHVITGGNNRAKAFHSACTVSVTFTNQSSQQETREYLMIAGGETGGATFTTSPDAYVLDLATQTWHQFTNKLPAAASKGVMIRNPQDIDSCLYAGGRDDDNVGLSAITKLELAVTSAGVPNTLTASSAGSLTVARSNLKAIPCGTNRVLFAGGRDDTTRLDTLDVWQGGTTVDTLRDSNNDPVTMTQARSDLAIAAKSSTEIAVFGGEDGTTVHSSMELIKVDNNCALTANLSSPFETPEVASMLDAGRFKLEAFYDSTAAKFRVLAGELANGNASALEDVITPDFTTPGSSTTTDSSPLVATKSPVIAITAGNEAFLVGPAVVSSTNVTAVQEYEGAAWSAVSTDSGSSNLVQREGSTATLANGFVYVVGGYNGATALHTVLKITP